MLKSKWPYGHPGSHDCSAGILTGDEYPDLTGMGLAVYDKPEFRRNETVLKATMVVIAMEPINNIVDKVGK